MVHAGACECSVSLEMIALIPPFFLDEAFKEAENATNSWEVLQREQGGLVWSLVLCDPLKSFESTQYILCRSAGHGFGGMVAQAHALKYKVRLLQIIISSSSKGLKNGAV